MYFVHVPSIPVNGNFFFYDFVGTSSNISKLSDLIDIIQSQPASLFVCC
jgi:hypothetical protein